MTDVLVVDDHATFRTSARALLTAEGFTVVGEAASGAAALDEAARLGPDLVLLDVRLPDLDGFTVASRLSGMHPAPTVVLVSSRPAKAYGTRVLTSSARGFLLKSELSGRALRALLR